MNRNIKHILIFLFCTFASKAWSQTFEWTGISPAFPNGVSNMVSYIDFGEVRFWGHVEFSITSDYNYQNTTGLYRKSYNVGRNLDAPLYSNTSEVTSALGPIANQWKLGEFEINSDNHLVVPIYHLVSTGNTLHVHIKGMSTVSVNTSLITITAPQVIQNSQIKDHNYVNGKLSVGTNRADADALLTVAGRISSREVKVTVDAGADFVFADDYKLQPLTEVARYISENQHLPEIASAEEMKKNGLELGAMDIKLLQKIEELTLHLIKISEKVDGLQVENSLLKAKIQEIEKKK
jgi:hypothetical protein